jgi:hypothetical protein
MPTLTTTAADNLGINDPFSRISAAKRFLSDNSGIVDLLTRRYTSRGGSVLTGSTGLVVYRVLWPADTNGVLIKTGPGQIKWYDLANNASAARFVKLYDMAMAPTVGGHAPWITICLPANSHAVVSISDGLQFLYGLGIGVSTGVADSDTTAASANDVIVNIGYV